MFSKKCPKCDEDIFYERKNSLQYSIRKNSVCKKCKGSLISEKLKGKSLSDQHKKKLSEIKKGSKLSEEHKKNIGLSVKGLKRSDESRKRYSKSKMGDKNPAKRQDVKDKIRNTIIKKYLSDPTYKKRISKSLIKYFRNNPVFVSFDELEDYAKFKNEVKRLTSSNKKILLENWNGLDYYDNEIIVNNFSLHYNNANYPTIDHKIPIIYGFKNGFSPEHISSIENLCFTKRQLNTEKGKNTEQTFKDKLSK